MRKVFVLTKNTTSTSEGRSAKLFQPVSEEERNTRWQFGWSEEFVQQLSAKLVLEDS